jgi:hypothetical protein
MAEASSEYASLSITNRSLHFLVEPENWVFQEVVFRKGDEDFTYLYSELTGFKNQRLPIESILHMHDT